MKNQKKILVFEPNWLGDILFSFPFLKALRAVYPEAYISCVVVPRYASLLFTAPWVDEIHMLSDKRGFFSLYEKLKFITTMKKGKYDTCFFLKTSKTKAAMAKMAGVCERIGFSGKDAALTKEVDRPEDSMHRADRMLSLLSAVSEVPDRAVYEYFVSEDDSLAAEDMIAREGHGAKKIIAVNPGGNWDAKRWPKENFVEVAKRLLGRFDNIEIMVTGAKKDIDLAEEIVEGAGEDRCFSVAGMTGLKVLAALFKRCSLVISADSGPLHLASAAGTTTIGIFGPTSSKITGPRGKGRNITLFRGIDCEIPCYEAYCGKSYLCMTLITPDEVFKEAEKILGGPKDGIDIEGKRKKEKGKN